MKKIWLLGGVALAAFATPAFAQQATGLYVSAGIGANWVGDMDGSADLGRIRDIPISISSDLSFDVGPVGVVAVGYDWGYLRTEAELGIRSNDLDKWEVSIGPFSDSTDNGHLRSITAMANALIDFDIGPVTVYGGGGLGLANVELYAEGESAFDTVFAYQGIAGVDFNINPQLAVGARYVYLSSFENLDFGDITLDDLDYQNHSVLATLRYTFSAAPAVAVAEVTNKSYLVFFDFDSSQLTPDAQSIVASAAADALAGGSPRLDVTGHTDRSGSDAYNQALSIRRATSVQNALIAGGVPKDIIVIRGAGESEPLVPTADGVREPQNRRVEIVVN